MSTIEERTDKVLAEKPESRTDFVVLYEGIALKNFKGSERQRLDAVKAARSEARKAWKALSDAVREGIGTKRGSREKYFEYLEQAPRSEKENEDWLAKNGTDAMRRASGLRNAYELAQALWAKVEAAKKAA
jgi:hypothetical protein